MIFGEANRVLESTTLNVVANPDTATIVAEISSANLTVRGGGERYQVTWVVGGSTAVIWLLEQAQSTNLDMSSVGTYRSQIVAVTPTNQSAQFVTRHNVYQGDLLRCRVQSSLTANVSAKIIAEPMV